MIDQKKSAGNQRLCCVLNFTRVDFLFKKFFLEGILSLRRIMIFFISARTSIILFGMTCLALCLLYDLENIGSVYPTMSMIVIGHSLLY
jgi:hypothetical protein